MTTWKVVVKTEIVFTTQCASSVSWENVQPIVLKLQKEGVRIANTFTPDDADYVNVSSTQDVKTLSTHYELSI